MDKATVGAALQAANLKALIPSLDTLLRPSIRLTSVPSYETAIPPGGTKLGGLPDLPTGTAWPEMAGAPMSFIAQIALGDVHPLDQAGVLPATGTLSFFYDASQQTFGADPKDRAGFKVLYFAGGPATLTRVDFPLNLPGEGRFRVCSLSARVEETLPLQPNLEEPGLTWTDDDQAKYDSMLQAVVTGDAAQHPIHRLLGNPDTIQDDMRLECQLAANGVADPSAPAVQAQVARLTPGAADWLLLLQVDSDPGATMTWANAGMLYFWIRREDLAARRFENAWVALQSE